MLKAVIFDMDGVLLDSQPMHYKGDQLTLSHFGVKIPIEEIYQYAGTTNEYRFQRYKEVYGLLAAPGDMIAYREALMLELVKTEPIVPISGIVPLLSAIKAQGLKTAIASSSSYPFIYAVVDKLGIRDYFDKVVSGEDVQEGKPAPDVFLAAAKVLEVAPEAALVVEDSANGVLAAAAAGMKCVGYINESSGAQDLSKATIIIEDFGTLTVDRLLEVERG